MKGLHKGPIYVAPEMYAKIAGYAVSRLMFLGEDLRMGLKFRGVPIYEKEEHEGIP